MVAGTVTGAGAKELTRAALLISGLGGLPVAAAIGAAGGAGTGVVREYLRQRRGLTIEESTEGGRLKNFFKNEFRRLKAADKTKLRNAALRGAVFGAVGGIAGGVIVDALQGQLENISLPTVSLPQVAVPNEVKEAAQQAARTAGSLVGGASDTLRSVLPDVQVPGVVKESLQATARTGASVAGGVSDTVRGTIKSATGVELPSVQLPSESVGPEAPGAPAVPEAELPTEPEVAGPEVPEEVPGAEAPAPGVPPAPEIPPTAEAAQPEVPAPEQPATPAGPETAPPPPPEGAAPTETGPTAPMEQTPQEVLTPTGTETITIEAGADPMEKLQDYLKDNLQRESTLGEMRDALTRLIDENNLSSVTSLPTDTPLNVGSVNEYIGQVLAETPPIPAEIAALPNELTLSPGSNPWSASEQYLKAALGRDPTNAEILKLDKLLCSQSNIAVPSWGIPGENLHTSLPVGYKLIIGDAGKALVAQMKLGG